MLVSVGLVFVGWQSIFRDACGIMSFDTDYQRHERGDVLLLVLHDQRG